MKRSYRLRQPLVHCERWPPPERGPKGAGIDPQRPEEAIELGTPARERSHGRDQRRGNPDEPRRSTERAREPHAQLRSRQNPLRR